MIEKKFTSQVKAQQFVASLVRNGLEPGSDFETKTKNGVYCVYVHTDEHRFGLFGA